MFQFRYLRGAPSMARVLEVENVSKRYSRNANSHLAYGLGDLLHELRGLVKERPLRADEFMAVDDVSFSLEAGDSLALIGRNGSGKTTLLKMMHGLIKPDKGEIRIAGSVQALINLGTGFNPNLSGKDNVFNAASLMGLHHNDTKVIFDEIVTFAELEEFIDSPFGTYSSGMKARLGFSVAVHLKPDILFIDEILGVGDFAFQNKCFARMQALRKSGTTFVLVSHSHTQVIQLCERALWMHQGKMRSYGRCQDVVDEYLRFLDEVESERLLTSNKAIGGVESINEASELLYGPSCHERDRVDCIQVELVHEGKPTFAVRAHSSVVIKYSFELLKPVENLNVTLNFHREDGLLVSVISTLRGNVLAGTKHGRVACEVDIQDLHFVPGNYVVTMPIHEGHGYLYRGIVLRLRVTSVEGMYWGITELGYRYRICGLATDKES